jgi:predicted nucleic acid binding AN1-type Zn finger protein
LIFKFNIIIIDSNINKMCNKCPICNKKSNQLGLVCKCGNKYCMQHRLPEHHNCTYDYKTEFRVKLMENLTSSKSVKFTEEH